MPRRKKIFKKGKEVYDRRVRVKQLLLHLKTDWRKFAATYLSKDKFCSETP